MTESKIYIKKLVDLSKWADRIANAGVLLIGCSAGGFQLLCEIIMKLRKNFPLPVIVVIHRSRKHKSTIEAQINSKSNVKVIAAADKDVLKSGTVYFAPCDYHLLLEPGNTLTLDSSEPILYSRPSIDVTFESVADVFNNKVIALLLSGSNCDGANGMKYVHARGGMCVVQNPLDASFKTMPEEALKKSPADLILNNLEIFSFMDHLATINNRQS